MKLIYYPYLIVTSILFVFLIPCLWIYSRLSGKFRDHFPERLGIIPKETAQKINGPVRIWIHAVSLGEIRVAASLISSLKKIIPDCSLVLSTTTPHGRALAHNLYKDDIPIVYAPIDFWFSVHRALKTVNPDVMVFLETEIWPTWIFEAARQGIKIVMVNGRISINSFRIYKKFKLFFGAILKYFNAFSMITSGDADRIKKMGATPEKIKINGNAKYDLLGISTDASSEDYVRQLLCLHRDDKIFIAGSTRNGEESLVMESYEKILAKFPDTILVIIPRHIERTREIERILKEKGFGYQLRTDLDGINKVRTEKIVIVNTFGELFKMYSVGTIVFSGGSLVHKGGQNPLEPAVWGKVPFYGPSMENFSDALALLDSVNGGIQVKDAEELSQKAIWFLEHPEQLIAYGQRAKAAVLKNEGSAQKHAMVIKRILYGP